jgi:hypothetical protein
MTNHAQLVMRELCVYIVIVPMETKKQLCCVSFLLRAFGADDDVVVDDDDDDGGCERRNNADGRGGKPGVVAYIESQF